MREIVFGFEDSLVSTLGTLTGIAIGSRSTYIVILSGFVLIAAESMSMAAGSYLSSKSASEAEQLLHEKDGKPYIHDSHPVRAGIVMGVLYFIGGFVPLLPYFFISVSEAIVISIPLTATCLFLLGVWSSEFTKRNPFKSGVEMTVISLAAALIGYFIGWIVSIYFGAA
ncbi:VIT1/CCC1 transporter family protein [Candidatus Uhrbacteria bacterium]|nr:VIT1/CCC1 transporter family protein [Candidatus Uhrbacteria bacterium]